jgi:hypothetical protein
MLRLGGEEAGTMKGIRRKAVDLKTLRLSPEEGFVLSRLDAPLSLRELVSLTGLEESRVASIVETLASQGALDMDRDAPPAAATPAQTVEAAPQEDSQPELPVDDGNEPADGDAEEETAEDAEKRAVGEREYRKLYEMELAPLERDARVSAAETGQNPTLFALCFDPDPQVIHAVLKNPKAGLEHARMIAQHHRTHVGLDAIARRSDYLADQQVQRRLLKNPQLPDAMLRRMVSPKLIMDVYKIAVDRENPEMTRMKVRELLQKKFMLGSPDERAALIIKTDARCLVLLVNCALDARTTQILCGKQSYTVLFIQNVARWTASPPALLTHLLKLPIVRQSMGLRKMLLKHPNVPMETKRNMS